MMFTSRSAVEAFQDCPRYRYNQYFLGGKGVVPIAKSIPLVTGSTVHKGVEQLLGRVRIGQEPNVDTAVQIAVETYRTECENEGFRFSGKGVETDRQQLFTYNEQRALIEGLIRAYYIAELPRIRERFKVIHVERDIEPLELTPEIMFQAKVDAEFQDLNTGDFINYSLKTMKSWDEREENSYKNDLQGITEIWAVEQDSLRGDKIIDELIAKFGELDSKARCRITLGNIEQMMGFLLKKKQRKKVSGVRFCILIKGVRKKPDYFGSDPDALFITYNPLIRGYKRITPTSIEYAHSWSYPNPENKSGKSILGKGWEPFNVWEDMGVKKWCEMLPGIQPECGDVFKQQVVTPIEYWRGEGEIEEAIEEIKHQELRVQTGITKCMLDSVFFTKYILDSIFPHIRKHCEFHFGGSCEYKMLCWKPEVAQDPIGSRLYQIRVPHHKAEREEEKNGRI